MKRKLAIFGVTGEKYAPLLAAHLPKWEIVACADIYDMDKLMACIDGSEAAILSAEFVLTPGHFGRLLKNPALKIVLQPWAGTDWLDATKLPKGLIICNATGHATPIAEHVLGCMLEHVLCLRTLDGDMRAGRWHRSGRNNHVGARHGDLAEKKLGLIGYGEIGQEIARRASAFNMKIAAIANRPRDTTPAPLDWIGVKADLPKLLAESDFLVLACDLNAQTKGLIATSAFTAMKPDAYLVNVARGEIVDEEALYTSLRDKRIAGAAIDTWYRYPENIKNAEPDPEKNGGFQGSLYDFNALDNVLLTPHSAAHTPGADKGRYVSLAKSIQEHDQNAPLTRCVLIGTGENM